jgi:endo-1,4-beta-xylanase
LAERRVFVFIKMRAKRMIRAELSRRAVILSTLAASLGQPAAARPSISGELAELPSLKDVGRASGVAFGLSEPTYLFPANVGYYEQLCRECNILAPGNEFNWANVEKTRDKRGYGKLDQIAAFARDRDVKMIGHTLLWYHTIPKWLGELDSAGLVGAMEVYVSETVSRFRGLVARWDVVNEPIRVPDGPEGLRRSLFTERLGADYIKQAFAFAKAADSQVSLCCNEFGFEYKKREDALKRAAFLKLLRRLRDDNVAVDCVGLQSHLDASLSLDIDGMTAFVKDIKSLGYKIAITELDVIDAKLDADEETRDRLVARHVDDYLGCVTAEVRPTTITCWGFTDSHTWLTMFHRRRDGRAMRPLPFDDQFNRKEMWSVIRRYLG